MWDTTIGLCCSLSHQPARPWPATVLSLYFSLVSDKGTGNVCQVLTSWLCLDVSSSLSFSSRFTLHLSSLLTSFTSSFALFPLLLLSTSPPLSPSFTSPLTPVCFSERCITDKTSFSLGSSSSSYVYHSMEEQNKLSCILTVVKRKME